MPVSADIYGRIEQPRQGNILRDYANVIGIQQGQQQNELGRLKMDEARRGIEQQNTLADLWRGAVKPDGTIDRSALLSGAASRGLGNQIPGLQKQFSEQDKAGADLSKSNSETKVKDLEAATKRIDLAGQAFNYVRQNPTVENAMAVLDHLGQNGVYTPEQVAQYKAKVQAQPDQVGQMADMAFRAALSAKDQLAKIDTQNLGGTSQQLSTDPVSGKSQVLRTDAITQSADNAASNARAAAEGAANRGVTMRGQNLVDARAKDATAQASKAPAGYRYKADGTMEAIPGGPADLKNTAGTVAKVTDAQDVLSLLDIAGPLIDKSTNSYAGAAIDEVGRAFGGATDGAKAAAQLRTLEGALISKMPKMSGPQSDKDVLLYKQMAGQIGDRTIPAEQKRAAMQTIREINERHAGAGKPQKVVVRTGKSNGRKVVEYSDGTMAYAD